VHVRHLVGLVLDAPEAKVSLGERHFLYIRFWLLRFKNLSQMSLVQGDFGNFSISIFFLVTEKCWSLKKIVQRNFFIFLKYSRFKRSKKLAVRLGRLPHNMCNFVRTLDYPHTRPRIVGKCRRVGFQ
jgi:hypothetical protein